MGARLEENLYNWKGLNEMNIMMYFVSCFLKVEKSLKIGPHFHNMTKGVKSS